MGANTNIEWATHTLNWWTGCEAIGPGCAGCYAESWAKRAGRDFAERRLTTAANRRQPLRWNKNADAFEAEHGHRQRVFTNSLADVFDNKVPQQWRDDLFATIKATPRLDWLLLTKRIGNVPRMLPEDWAGGYENVWLGATVVNQEEADRDIPKLLARNAAVHFLSCEPLLGPIDLMRAGAFRTIWWDTSVPGGRAPVGESVDLVIVGGESGPKARPMHPSWARSIRDQCVAASVPHFFKQHGEWVERDSRIHGDIPQNPCVRLGEHGRDTSDLTNCESAGEEVWLQRVGKKAAGRILDGREWNEFPEPRS